MTGALTVKSVMQSDHSVIVYTVAVSNREIMSYDDNMNRN